MSNHSEPNIVLRGGPFDGKRMRVGSQAPVSLKVDGKGKGFAYRPTTELDHEYPTLVAWILDGAEAS
jgi:hypothetical protein